MSGINDDGDRIAHGMEPRDDMFRPHDIARGIAECLYGDDAMRKGAAAMLGEHCRMARECEGMAARHGVYYQYVYGLILGDQDDGMSRTQAVASHDWDDVWREAGRAAPPPARKGGP